MKKDTHITEVIFRKYKPSHNFGVNDTIVAVFPYEIFNERGDVTCYEFCGQHGEANYNHIINTMTTPATEKESAELKKHLEVGFGYNFRIMKRRNHKRFLKNAYAIRNQ